MSFRVVQVYNMKYIKNLMDASLHLIHVLTRVRCFSVVCIVHN